MSKDQDDLMDQETEDEVDDTELEDEDEDAEDEDSEAGDKDEDNVDDDGSEKAEKPKMVKLSRHLKVVNRLKDKLAKATKQGEDVSTTDIKSIADEFNVDEKFVEKLLGAVIKKVKPDITKIELSQKENQVKAAFDKEFDRLAAERPELKGKRDLLWSLLRNQKYRKMTVDEIADDVFDLKGKESSESDDKAGSKDDLDDVDYSTLTNEQADKILANPAKRQKYFAWLDTQQE